MHIPERMTMPSILDTIDRLVDVVPWDDRHAVLVHRREHGGRAYVRLQSCSKYRRPKRRSRPGRFFVIPLKNAKPLADAIYAAVEGRASPKPPWLEAREEEEKRLDEV